MWKGKERNSQRKIEEKSKREERWNKDKEDRQNYSKKMRKMKEVRKWKNEAKVGRKEEKLDIHPKKEWNK